MSAGGDVVVSVERLTRRYGTLVAVDEVSFEVRRGEMFGLIGPDGAGKTSTLRVLLGLLPAHGGTVRTCGLDPGREARALAGRVGYLSQRFSLYGDLSVDENIAFFAEIHGVAGWREHRDRLLDLVRMTPFRARLAEKLSGGMKQKLALACTLVHTPELLVLDEPTTGVDPVSRRDFWRLLARLQRDGLTLLITTPYLDEAERCQRVVLMDHGRTLSLDTPTALREQEPGVLVEIVARPRPQAALLLKERADVSEVEAFGERLHVSLPAVPRDRGDAVARELETALAAAGLDVEQARPILPSLEDVFIRRMRASAPATGATEVRA
ncbi:MAG: ABC transporter ATP-binding protein [Vicinamibacteria bacterium]